MRTFVYKGILGLALLSGLGTVAAAADHAHTGTASGRSGEDDGRSD